MNEMDPVRKCDQPVRVFEKGSALVSDPGVHWECCAKCPKYEPPRLWCPLRAETRQPDASACRYGIVLMGATKQEEYRDAKTSS
jgi:hypothetical protein